MIVSIHAAQRFLERCIGKNDYTKEEIIHCVKYLNKVFHNVIPNSYAKRFAMPGFENKFYVIHKQNVVVTIIPKEK